jgi:hypothetical protein
MVAPLRYTANNNFSTSTTPWSLGFNVADCGPSNLSALPAGVTGLVWIDGAEAGLTASVKSQIDSCVANVSKIWGFYITDEPNPATVPAANLQAVANYCRSSMPGKKIFTALYGEGTQAAPSYAGSHALAAIYDYVGVDPYPARSDVSGGFDLASIDRNVAAVIAAGFSLSQIVPVIQCFAEPPWTMPTDAQFNQILARWDSLVPSPALEYVYSWGVQTSSGMTVALSTSPSKQTIIQARYAAVVTPPPPTAEAYYTGTAAPASSVGAVGDVYAQVTETTTQGPPTYTQGPLVITVPAPVVTVTTKFWKKTSTGWVAQ